MSQVVDDIQNDEMMATLELAGQACTAYERPDLGKRMERALESVTTTDARVVVVGEFKQGKSTLINSLLNVNVCPVDDDIATAVPTAIRFGERFHAEAVVLPRGEEAPEPVSWSLTAAQIPMMVTEGNDAYPEVEVKGVEVSMPKALLKSGLMLVDTPGVGGLGSAHATATLGALSIADAVVFVTDASQELTNAELEFLEQARQLCPNVVSVLTKIDFYPAWRRVLELDQSHLQRRGIDTEIIPVSAVLRRFAAKHNDRTVNEESGFPRLLSFLRDDIVGNAAERARLRAASELLDVSSTLHSHFETKLEALTDPEAAEAMLQDLRDAKERAELLRSGLSKWQIRLNDGMTDIMGNVDFDFRGRMRRVVAEADETLSEGDPADTWAEFEPWLVNKVSQEVIANYRYLTELASELASDVGDLFADAGTGAVSPFLDVSSPEMLLDQVEMRDDIDLEKKSLGSRGFTMMRGGQSGVIMFSMVGSMAGLTVIAPVLIGVGLIFGRKGLKDEAERQRSMRQSQAKNAMRKYCDDVSFQVNKDSRDTLKRVQRTMRDQFGERAEEARKTSSASLIEAERAAKLGAAERQAEAKNAKAELARVAALRAKAQELAGLPSV